MLAHKDRAGRRIQEVDLFGPTLQVASAGVSPTGRPRLPIRLMVSLRYLKHAYGLSDEAMVERWSESVVWQFFSGMTYYENLACRVTPRRSGAFAERWARPVSRNCWPRPSRRR